MAKIQGTTYQGEAVFKKAAAQKLVDKAQLGPGKWALHSRSTVPFARVACGAVGSRDLTWGEIYEVPAGHFGMVSNASFHQGDIIFAETGGDTAPERPGRVTVPARIRAGAETTQTDWVDTRLARRVYLAATPLQAVQGGFSYTVLLQAPTQGEPVSPTATAALQGGGVVVFTRAVVQPLEVWPLGFASGEYLDTAGKSYPELRPMALLDRLRVRLTKNTAGALGFVAGLDAFYILEY
jgi:hypothetical protein